MSYFQPEANEQTPPSPAQYKINVPSWHYVWALVQIALASMVMPVFFEIILTQGSELSVTEVPAIWVIGIGFATACVYAVVTNVLFIGRSIARRGKESTEMQKEPHFRIKPVYWAFSHIVVGILLAIIAILIIGVYGNDIFREIPLVGIFGSIAFYGYAGTCLISGARGFFLQRRHLPHTRLGTGFRGLGIILVVALPVAGASTLFAGCDKTLSFPAEVTLAQDLFSQG